jgi:hypothetical protein
MQAIGNRIQAAVGAIAKNAFTALGGEPATAALTRDTFRFNGAGKTYKNVVASGLHNEINLRGATIIGGDWHRAQMLYGDVAGSTFKMRPSHLPNFDGVSFTKGANLGKASLDTYLNGTATTESKLRAQVATRHDPRVESHMILQARVNVSNAMKTNGGTGLAELKDGMTPLALLNQEHKIAVLREALKLPPTKAM